MKFTISAGDLASSLRGPYDRAKISSVIPILKHIRVKTSDQSIHLLGHDLDSSSEAIVAAEIDQEGSCCIPAEPLLRLISGLPKAAHVVFEVQDQAVIIKSGRSRYKLPILDAKDMPEPLSAEGGIKIILSSKDVELLFQRAKEAVDDSGPNPMLHGVFLHLRDGKLYSAATDGYWITEFGTETPVSEFPETIIPRRAVEEILKFGSGEMQISNRIISISLDGKIFAFKLIEATYPKEQYRRTILPPVQNPTIVDREYLLECVNRLNSVNYGNSMIDIEVLENELSISMVAESSGAEKIECESQGEKFAGDPEKFICLRASQLVEALKIMRGDKIELHITDQSKPFRIIDPSEPSAINVLMPCASKNRRAAAA